MHPDFDSKPSKNPFDRYPVIAYRNESGSEAQEHFFVFEIDLPNDDLGPRSRPRSVTEGHARVRLAELGLTEPEIDARIAWARKWMATRIVSPGTKPVTW